IWYCNTSCCPGNCNTDHRHEIRTFFLFVGAHHKTQAWRRNPNYPDLGTCIPSWPPVHSCGNCLRRYLFQIVQICCTEGVFQESIAWYAVHTPSWWNHPTSLFLGCHPLLPLGLEAVDFPVAVPMHCSEQKASIGLQSGA